MSGAGGLDHETLVVKSVTARAVAAAGGTKMLSPLIRQQRLSDLQNRNAPDIVRLTEAALLDELSPAWPHFAHYLADRAGCALIALPAPYLPETIWGQFIGLLLAEVGALSAGLGADLADDNDVSPKEAAERLAGAEAMVNAAVQVHEALKRRAEGGW